MEIKKTVNRENLTYRANEYTYSFKIFQTIKTFGWDIYNGEITLMINQMINQTYFKFINQIFD